MRRAVLIYNPASGRRRGATLVPGIVQRLETGGFDVEPLPTAAAGDATALARRAAEQGTEVVFALGGDGTLREAAAGLLGTSVPLGPLPGGTTNVLAKALGIPPDPLAASSFLCNLSAREIDVGLVGDEPYLMLASCGLDADIMRRQNHVPKRTLGKLAIFFLGLWRWWAYDYPLHRIEVAGQVHDLPFFALCNIPLYAGDFRLAPGAEPSSGHLELVRFASRGRWASFRFGVDLARGRLQDRPDVHMQSVDEVRVLAPSSLTVQLDGDIVEVEAPVRIGLASQRLKILAPNRQPET